MKLTFLPFLRTNRQVYGGRPLTGNLSNVILSLRRILRYQPTTWDPSLCLLRVTPPLRCLDDGLVAIFLFQQLLVVLVAWKDAAARKLSVLSDALVTPSSTGSAVAGSPPSAST